MTILTHVKSKSKCIYHYDIYHYLSNLYCDYNDKLRQCVNNPYRYIARPHSQYDKLRNWKIPDERLIDRYISVNINNEAISTESMNASLSLETGWKSHVNITTSGWVINTNSSTNSGLRINITSNRSSTCARIPTYILPAL